ncbi:MAG: hypothetical protein GXY82_07610 [Methanospirillum sp.]|nr:hypothetical protein [Methanospirillum sp.]
MEFARCSRCRREAVAFQAYSGRALCAEHLLRDIEARGKRAIRQQGGLGTRERVGVFVEEGGAGAALLWFAVRQFGRRRDTVLVALLPGESAPPGLPEGVEVAAIGDRGPESAAAGLGCNVLALPTTLEEMASSVLGAVLAGRQATLADGRVQDGLRVVRPFQHVPATEVGLYLALVSGEAVPPAGGPRGAPDPVLAFAAEELARHAAAHPSAPFALVRVAGAITELGSGDRGVRGTAGDARPGPRPPGPARDAPRRACRR